MSAMVDMVLQKAYGIFIALARAWNVRAGRVWYKCIRYWFYEVIPSPPRWSVYVILVVRFKNEIALKMVQRRFTRILFGWGTLFMCMYM